MTLDPASAQTSDEGIILTFPKGLLGFPQLTSFRLFEPPDGYPLKFLQSTESEEVSFICIDPAGVKQDYGSPWAKRRRKRSTSSPRRKP
jgi:flagellar assembly factor FliW